MAENAQIPIRTLTTDEQLEENTVKGQGGEQR